MHQIVLLTALSATTGLFGGGRHHGGCGGAYAAPAYTTCAPTVAYAAPKAHCGLRGFRRSASCGAPAPCAAPVTYAAPAPCAAPAACGSVAYPTVTAAPQAQPYAAHYYAPATTCAGGSCARP